MLLFFFFEISKILRVWCGQEVKSKDSFLNEHSIYLRFFLYFFLFSYLFNKFGRHLRLLEDPKIGFCQLESWNQPLRAFYKLLQLLQNQPLELSNIVESIQNNLGSTQANLRSIQDQIYFGTTLSCLRESTWLTLHRLKVD